MRKKIFLLFILIFTIYFCAAPLKAQTNDSLLFSISTLQDITTACSTGGYWRFHPGDNPEWADPDYDDSNWEISQTIVWYDEYDQDETIKLGWYS